LGEDFGEGGLPIQGLGMHCGVADDAVALASRSKPPRNECRMQNAEWPGKAAQSQVHARYKPGTSHVLGRRLGGASQVHARYM
jgi:hypothetical protein